MSNLFYTNKLYPLQDAVLRSIASVECDFYLTGGTALSRAYLGHRYSDDLDFFLNNSADFKKQADLVRNILSNKVCALSRLEPKDVADILLIAKKYAFGWEEVIDEAREKDLWVEPVAVSQVINEFPAAKLQAIQWINPVDVAEFLDMAKTVAKDILMGRTNTLYSPPGP